jgi:plasmid stabilization system protein ParE
MGQVIWTEPALGDLRAIIDFVAMDSPTYAARLGTRLVEAPRRLIRLPRSGSRVPEFDLDHIREVLSVRPYRIIYELRGEHCYVVAVVHARRDLPTLFGSEAPDRE